jgi:Zn-dependent protease with chaperone function
MLEISAFRHPREKVYFLLAAALGVCCLPLTIPMAIGLAPLLWFASGFFRASLYGNAALVSERQYPEIHKMVLDGCRQLGLENPPKVFVTHGEGALNALAVKFFKGQYVILYAGLIDLMVEKQMARELKMIIGHELGHHAAGHTSMWKGLLIMPAQMMPYLGMAYSRACEFTADRLGAACAGDLPAAKRALVTMAVGSKVLKTDMGAFVAQEQEVGMFGRISELYATHPRITRRVMELDAIAPLLPKRKTAQIGASRQVPQAEAAVHEGMPVDR